MSRSGMMILMSWQVTARAERHCIGGKVSKTASVQSSPFSRLMLSPWAEDASVLKSSPAGASTNTTAGHVEWHLKGGSANVTLSLDAACRS